jgi:hypothetical protein
MGGVEDTVPEFSIPDRFLIEDLPNAVLHSGPFPIIGGAPGKGSVSPDGVVFREDGSICTRAKTVFSPIHNLVGSARLDLETLQGEEVRNVQRLSGRHLFGGLLRHQFGHFLSQSCGRLWAAAKHFDAESMIFFADPAWQSHRDRGNDPLKSRWISDFFEIIGVNNVTVVDRSVSVEKLLVPGNDGYWFGWNGRNLLFDDGVRSKILSTLPSLQPGKKIYISRREFALGQGGTGGIILELILEENLKRAGYTIITPEKMSINEQMAAYAEAEMVISPDISALHLYAMIASPLQKLCIVNRRLNFDHCKHFMNQLSRLKLNAISANFIDGIFDVYWRPGKSLNLSMLNFEKIRDFLRENGFIGGGDWYVPTPNEVQEAHQVFRSEGDRRQQADDEKAARRVAKRNAS